VNDSEDENMRKRSMRGLQDFKHRRMK